MRKTLLALAVVLAWPQSGRADEQTYIPCASSEQPLSFTNYWVGPSFDGLQLSVVIWECAKPFPDEPIRLHGVTYIYENCDPFDAGCEHVDVQIYSTPAVERNKESLDLVGEDTTIGAVPASWYEDGWRLEIYFPDTTLVIHGPGRDRIERFARALRPGPRVLTDLEAFGVHFPEECRRNVRYCTAESLAAPGPTLLQAILDVLAVAIPALMLGVLLVVALQLRGAHPRQAPPPLETEELQGRSNE